MLTLRDVAARAGVSVSAVSLVLNDRSEGRIAPELAERIRAVAAELEYVPNLVARGLKTRRTGTIGLLSDQVASTPFAGSMLAAAQQEAWLAGYLLLLIDTAGDPELEAPAMTALLQRNVDGLIYASMFHRRVDFTDFVVPVPLVVLDGVTDRAGVDWVVPDESGGAQTAVGELIAAGHRRIGFCNNAEPIPASVGRLEGYLAAHREAGLTVDPSLVVEAEDSNAASGATAARALLDRADRPTAVFCFSDRMAMGLYRTARALGIGIPADLSVVGFDDQEYVADAIEPGLSTVRLPHEAMGRWAARRILERITDESARSGPGGHRLEPCVFVRRDSIAQPRQS